jgi:hypothetical protein
MVVHGLHISRSSVSLLIFFVLSGAKVLSRYFDFDILNILIDPLTVGVLLFVAYIMFMWGHLRHGWKITAAILIFGIVGIFFWVQALWM